MEGKGIFSLTVQQARRVTPGAARFPRALRIHHRINDGRRGGCNCHGRWKKITETRAGLKYGSPYVVIGTRATRHRSPRVLSSLFLGWTRLTTARLLSVRLR
jgi:hypothetical protein